MFKVPKSGILYKVQIFTLLFILNFCNFAACSSYEDNPELDSQINKTLDTLMKLDTTLAKDSNDPPVDGGDNMKEMVRQYNEACSNLLSLCKEDKLRVLRAASDMLEPGGPKFLDVEINKGEMKRNFKWDEDNINELLSLTKGTYSCWKSLWSLYNNFP